MSGAAHVSERFRALDGWRGVCALLVAAHHLESYGFLYWQPLIRQAWLFVDFFFVLSGFVIAHSYGARLSTGAGVRDFAWRRFARLWPLHIGCLLALIGLELARLVLLARFPSPGAHAAFTEGRSVWAIVTNLFLVQGMGLHDHLTWNGPSWSISTEFWTYLIFAAVCLSASGQRLRRILSVLLLLGAVAVLAHWSPQGMRETSGFGFFRCLYGFFAGVLTYELWRSRRLAAVSGTWLEAAVILGIVAFLTFAAGKATLEYLATPLFALAVLIFASERGALSALLTTRPFAALGRWSYSIYMVHTVVLATLFSAVHSAEVVFHASWLRHDPDGNANFAFGWGNDVLMFVFPALTVAVAALTWRVIERPGQRLFGPGPRRQAIEPAPQSM